jgi:hypothetical protein
MRLELPAIQARLEHIHRAGFAVPWMPISLSPVVAKETGGTSGAGSVLAAKCAHEDSKALGCNRDWWNKFRRGINRGICP